MNNEEIEKSMVELKENIAKFGPAREISGKEWRQKRRLIVLYEVLEGIQKARLKGSKLKESQLMAYYGLLIQEKTMNPVLYFLLKVRMRSSTWS